MNTVEVKATEMTGRALDWAVGKAVGLNVQWSYRLGVHLGERVKISQETGWLPLGAAWHPSRWWSHCGPLIENERVRIAPPNEFGGWQAAIETADSQLVVQEDDSPLVAVCRAIVLAKWGNEMWVPEKLVITRAVA